MNLKKIEIKQATADDISVIRHFLVERAQWLAQKNIDQWQQFITYDQTKQIEKDFEQGVLYVAKYENECLGAIVITPPQEFDRQLWEKAEGYFYIHRYVVSPKFKGQGIGELLLLFALEQAREYKLGLRLDCRANNSQLRAYYQKQGWLQRGIVNGYARFEWSFNN